MKALQGDVRRFMATINQFAENAGVSQRQSIGDVPAIHDAELRARLIMEEAAETAEALTGYRWNVTTNRDTPAERPGIVEVADGCADIIVVTLGTAVACGIDLAPVYQEVMRSNWTKFRPGATMRADGKFVKAETFEEPNVAEILRKQGWQG